jgi:hypothetical protein
MASVAIRNVFPCCDGSGFDDFGGYNDLFTIDHTKGLKKTTRGCLLC